MANTEGMTAPQTPEVLTVTPEQQAQIDAAFRICSGNGRRITGEWVARFDESVAEILGYTPPPAYTLFVREVSP